MTEPRLFTPKTILDHELIRDFCEIVAAGNFRLTACQRLGIPYHVHSGWMRKGRKEINDFAEDPTKETTIFAHYVLALEAVEAPLQQSLVQDVVAGDLKAKMWFLTHRWNKLFTRNTNSVIDDDEAEVQRIDPAIVLADRLRELQGKLGE